MEELKILQKHFEQAAMQFVGLYHKFLWRGKKKDYSLVPYELTFKHESELKRELKREHELKTKTRLGTLCSWDQLEMQTFGSTLFNTENKKDSEYVPDVPKAICLRQYPHDLDQYIEEHYPEKRQYSHADFLIKPAQAKWDSNAAWLLFFDLLVKLVPYIHPTELGLNNDPLYNYVNDFDSRHSILSDMLLILHILMKSTPLRINTDAEATSYIIAQKDEPYVRVIQDVFSSFALVCEMLLNQGENDLVKKPIGQKQEKAYGERWSRPMTKSDIVTALHLDSTHKLNQLIDRNFYSVKQVGNNRQSWQIRIDKLDYDIQKKLI